MIGMRYIIHFIMPICCCCSGVMAYDCCFCVMTELMMVATHHRTQKMDMWSPMPQMLKPQLMTSS